MIGFTYETRPQRVVFGVGAAREKLAGEIEALGADRVVVISTERSATLAGELSAPLHKRVVGRFASSRSHVPVEVAEAAREVAKSSRADCLLCVGGGSTVGVAKAVALETGAPIVAVPTTYSGSEMTPVYGITEGGRKTTGKSDAVLPKVVVYDPELTLSLPPEITGPSAINAMAHCVEAFYAFGANPIASLMAEEGIRSLAEGVVASVDEPEGIEGRTTTLYGAYLSGAAFASAGGGLHHKLCHTLGGAFDLPHAETHTVVLPHVVAFKTRTSPKSTLRVARTLRSEDPAHGIHALVRRIGAPASLREIGLEERDLAIAMDLCAEAAETDDVRGFIRDAYHGREPGLRHDPISGDNSRRH